jgi:opacity protein-like surface antigen
MQFDRSNMISRFFCNRGLSESGLRQLGLPAVALVASLFGPAMATAQSTQSNPTVAPGAPQQVTPMTAPGGFSIYPKNGQSQEQQSADRYECHSWAKAQTGYDPTLTQGGVAASESSSKLQSYRRAMSACLDAKGYSVTVVTPPTYVAPPPSPPPAGPPLAPRVAAGPAVYADVGPELKYRPFHFQIDGGYSIPAGDTRQDLNGGAVGGLGFAWFPSSALPVGIRADGSYNHFGIKNSALAGSGADWGHENVYGGDADLQLNLAHRSSRAQMYLLGGVGWYREQAQLRGVSWVNGTVCNWFWCGPGTYPALTERENSTSGWLHSWNAGLGWETAISDYASFFVEARYERIKPYDSRMSFVPVTVGLRF